LVVWSVGRSQTREWKMKRSPVMLWGRYDFASVVNARVESSAAIVYWFGELKLVWAQTEAQSAAMVTARMDFEDEVSGNPMH
jgi:hypothetical protein